MTRHDTVIRWLDSISIGSAAFLASSLALPLLLAGLPIDISVLIMERPVNQGELMSAIAVELRLGEKEGRILTVAPFDVGVRGVHGARRA